MSKSVQQIEGVEFGVEENVGHIKNLDATFGKRNASIEIDADGLRIPVKASVDTNDAPLWAEVQQLHAAGRRVAFRIEIHRDSKVDPSLPFDEVGQFDRFRRLTWMRAETPGGQLPPPPSDNGQKSFSPDVTPGPRVAEGRPWERLNSDGSVNLGSYSIQASISMVELAHELLSARRAEEGLQGPPPIRQVKALAARLLKAADTAQAIVRADHHCDRLDNSHTRARGAVRVALRSHPVPWTGEPEALELARKQWVEDLATYASALVTTAMELDG